MSDPLKILEALAALADVVPGAPRSLSVSIHGCTQFRAFVDAFGAKVERYENEACTQEWESATVWRNGVSITAYSQHRPLQKATPVDEAALDHALKLTAKAVQS